MPFRIPTLIWPLVPLPRHWETVAALSSATAASLSAPAAAAVLSTGAGREGGGRAKSEEDEEEGDMVETEWQFISADLVMDDSEVYHGGW